MAGDVRNPFKGLKGYQFWALLGAVTIVVPRILMAYGIPLGVFTITIWEGSQATILVSDALGFLMVFSAYVTYRDFVNRATA